MRRAHCLCLVVALGLAGCGGGMSSGATPTPHAGTHPGDVAPPLRGTSLEGHELSLGGQRGSVVVLVFWASWCTPCQAEQPAVNALAREEASAGVRFVGVSVDVDRSAAEAYMTRYAVPYESLIDAAQSIVVDYDVAGPPTTFVIDRAGRVAAELLGQLSIDDLRARVVATLAAP